MKIISSFFYNLRQGLKGIMSHKTMSFISIGSVTASLVILGIVLSMVLNVNEFIKNTKDQVNEVRVSISNKLDENDRETLESEVENMQGIKNTKYESKEDAFEKMKASWGEDAYLLDGMENPLEDSFIVTIENADDANTIVDKLRGYEGVTEVNYYQDVMQNFVNLSNTAKKVGLVVITALLIICLVIISNTIKSRVYSKKEEIKIMKYIGASDGFIIAPFIIEGFVIGIVGAGISIVISSGVYGYFYESLSRTLYSFAPNVLMNTQDIIGIFAFIFIIIGILIGVTGSIISVKKHLKV